MAEQFVGSGWAFPLRIGPTGGIALVSGDAQRLTQLLRSLLDFAASRGNVSGVVLRSGDGRARLDVVVAEGGTPSADAGTLLDAPQREPYDEGLGLRLLLAREIARAHGGELVAEAADGRLRLRCELPTSA